MYSSKQKMALMNSEMMFLFVVLIISLSISCYEVGARNINGTPTKSQETMDSDFECVGIYKQPSLKHPLLKNHKIQHRPSFARDIVMDRFKIRRCPLGSVPIHRRKVRQQINITSKSQLQHFHQYSQSNPGHHFATLDTTQATTYHGASAKITIYNLTLQQNQYSMSQIWLQNGPPSELNVIKVGSGVDPGYYGDTQTRITGFWTVDNFQKTGCINYNAHCSGFVQVDPNVFLGAAISPTSVIGSRSQQFFSPFLVKQDQNTGHWWLSAHDNKSGYLNIGYWPKEILTHLNQGASLVRFGGETFTPPNNMNSPPMGSGMLPQTHFGSSAYMSNLELFDSNYNSISVEPEFVTKNVDTNSNCYDLLYNGDQGSVFQQAFLFGGPGGQCGV
uniref:Uncharacterized protein LOC101489336 n=2 Tax=Cicer arietinum TaxID=3827 RepID=A0A3Q7XTE7_CICAR|nr:uncharacterized protein LOC101489336 [Cicer arietinum]